VKSDGRVERLADRLTGLLEDAISAGTMTPATAARVVGQVEEMTAKLRQTDTSDRAKLVDVWDLLRGFHGTNPDAYARESLVKELTRTKTRLVHLRGLAREWRVREGGMSQAELDEAEEWSLALVGARVRS
jgi:hypothetical protein